MKRMRVGIVMVMVSLIVGCNTTKSEWKDAQQTGTVQAYQQFLQKHPKGSYTRKAEAKIEELFWGKAKQANTVGAYNRYLKMYPSGKFKKEAKSNIETLDWLESKQTKTPQALNQFLKQYPKSKRKKEALEEMRRLEWEKAVKTNTLDAYKNFLSYTPQNRYTGQAKEKIQELTNANKRQAIRTLAFQTTTSTQKWSGGFTFTMSPECIINPRNCKSQMKAGKPKLVSPKKQHAFLILEMRAKAKEKTEIEVNKEILLVDAKGKTIRPSIWLDAPDSPGGWSSSNLTLYLQPGKERTLRCLYEVHQNNLAEAKLHLWGKNFLVKNYLK